MGDPTGRESTDQNQGRRESAMDRLKEAGRDLLGRGRAQGEPGTKQPDHTEARDTAGDVIHVLQEARTNLGVETYGPSSERAKQSGNLNPVPPHERKASQGPMQTAAADLAAGHLAAAETAILTQAESQARIESDPRHERDQKVFELARTGKLAGIAPSPAEAAAIAARSGMPQEVADLIPKTPEEQVAQDMPRLEEAERRANQPLAAAADATRKEETGTVEPGNVDKSNTSPSARTSTIGSAVRTSAVTPGEQEGAPRNNLDAMAREGKTIGGAEGEAQKRAEEGAAPKTDQHIIK